MYLPGIPIMQLLRQDYLLAFLHISDESLCEEQAQNEADKTCRTEYNRYGSHSFPGECRSRAQNTGAYQERAFQLPYGPI